MYDGSLRDVQVYGNFQFYRWWFIVHQDIDYPNGYNVSEASTGCSLQDYEYYESLEEALKCIIPLIESKRYYFATSVSDVLVKYNQNLLKVNVGTITPFLTLWM